ncbi:X-linked retinitis pigmentosa GTPase regulator-like [Venturia canescens]|uniref:X-linked retinitis pigmentosa GTPase regulator-like n=1 Tax=Venturia canescens TaxID=32260 RepID=UPI001C9BC236|nr:X-linked retinitis pigmentosa GTPase regulator-like [Venturia canescens]
MGLPDIDNIPDTGAVFTIGRSRFADNIASHFFIRKDPVVSVACGDEHSAVVCQSGRLFVFGSNDWGQLGLGHKNHVSKPSCVKILKPEKVTHVACGRAHTLICTGEQKIFACGSDQESQLGRGAQAVGDSSSSPIMVYDCGIAGPKILRIAAGSHHSLALMADGTVLAWGSNLEGQLGLPGTSGLVNKPTKVHMPEPVKQISAGYYHSAFLTESGNVYVCGEAESGKLGIALDFSTQVAPKQMQLPGPTAVVACGGHHTLILGEDGNIYCTGSNSSGQLGMGSNIAEIPTPKMLPPGVLEGETVKKIGCGESHVAIVTESGKLLTCGDGRHGKLGLEENENNVHELTLASKYQELVVSDVACGGCHTILVGRRRELDKDESTNEEQTGVQMKSLPPLKLPVSRIPSANTTVEKPEQVRANVENNAEEDTMEEGAEKTEEKVTSNGTTEMINDIIEKPESPKKLSDYEEKITQEPTEMDEKNDETVDNSENKNSEETPKNDDVENNAVTEVPEVEKAASPKSSVPEEAPTVVEEPEKPEKPETPEKSVIDNAETETAEKPDSPPLPIPPPKPPRQKIGSAEHSQSSRQGSSSSRMGSTGSGDKVVEEEHLETTDSELPIERDETKEQDEEKDTKSEEGSTKISASSEKSRSAKSRAGTDETAEIDGQHILDDVEENPVVQEATKVALDDADVVHSPVTRTGKMAKLFKTKKQEVENGTKAASTVDQKAKSKTCVIL